MTMQKKNKSGGGFGPHPANAQGLLIILLSEITSGRLGNHIRFWGSKLGCPCAYLPIAQALNKNALAAAVFGIQRAIVNSG